MTATDESAVRQVAAEDIRVGDAVHKQRGIWFTVGSIERIGDYVYLESPGRLHWKNARHDTLLRVVAPRKVTP